MITHLRLYTKRKGKNFYSFWLNNNFIKISLPNLTVIYSDRAIIEEEMLEINDYFTESGF